MAVLAARAAAALAAAPPPVAARLIRLTLAGPAGKSSTGGSEHDSESLCSREELGSRASGGRRGSGARDRDEDYEELEVDPFDTAVEQLYEKRCGAVGEGSLARFAGAAVGAAVEQHHVLVGLRCCPAALPLTPACCFSDIQAGPPHGSLRCPRWWD